MPADSTFMKRITAGEKTWVYEFDMQIASEWPLPVEPKPEETRTEVDFGEYVE